jgi:hypothetical protein
MKAYYAHCKAIYGTPQEDRDMALIASIGFEPVNPNAPEFAEGWRTRGMEYKNHFADTCDLIIFRGLPDGRIPAGVAKEIETFQARKKPVLELPAGVMGRCMCVEETREYLAEVGER